MSKVKKGAIKPQKASEMQEMTKDQKAAAALKIAEAIKIGEVLQTAKDKKATDAKKAAEAKKTTEKQKTTQEACFKKLQESFAKPDTAKLNDILSKELLNTLKSFDNLSANIADKYPESQFGLFQQLLSRLDLRANHTEKNLIKLHADVMSHSAQFIINQYAEEAKPDIKADRYKDALALFNKANVLVQKNGLELKINPEAKTRELIESYKSDKVANSDKQAFEFAKQSLEHQQSHLQKDHVSVLSALLTAAKTGDEVSDNPAKLEAINYAKLAYNMAIRTQKTDSAIEALKLEAGIYKFYGDEALATSLSQQADILKNIEGTNSPKDTIKIHQKLTQDALDIKLHIQETILNPIREAAADGKWINNQPIRGNFGVSGYLDDYLKKQLGELNNDTNIEIALKLCFEAINLGIMSSTKQNPLCAAIFAQKYPEIVKKTLTENPEYFVDGFIVRTSVMGAHEHAKSILGHAVEKNTSDYNAHFEKAIMPFVTTRIQKSVLDEIDTIIKSGARLEETNAKLMELVSEDYLKKESLVSNSYLGNNLSTENDMLNIVRILAFKTLADVIVTTNLGNYTPIINFTKAYPKIIERIKVNHPEYFLQDEMITKICTKTPEEVELCNQALKTIDSYKENVEKYAKDVKELEAANKTKIADSNAPQEAATEAFTALSNSTHEIENALTAINGLTSAAKAFAFQGNQKKLDQLLADMKMVSGVAKFSFDQATKAGEVITTNTAPIVENTIDAPAQTEATKTIPEPSNNATPSGLPPLPELDPTTETLLAGEQSENVTEI